MSLVPSIVATVVLIIEFKIEACALKVNNMIVSIFLIIRNSIFFFFVHFD